MSGDPGSGFHVGINVPDLDVALGFYRDRLGLREVWRHPVGGDLLESLTGIPGVRADVVQLAGDGGSRIELTCYAPVGAATPAAANDVGLTHLSLEVDDVRATHARLAGDGVAFACEPLLISEDGHPLDGWWVVYLADPFGLTLELLQRPANVSTNA